MGRGVGERRGGRGLGLRAWTLTRRAARDVATPVAPSKLTSKRRAAVADGVDARAMGARLVRRAVRGARHGPRRVERARERRAEGRCTTETSGWKRWLLRGAVRTERRSMKRCSVVCVGFVWRGEGLGACARVAENNARRHRRPRALLLPADGDDCGSLPASSPPPLSLSLSLQLHTLR